MRRIRDRLLTIERREEEERAREAAARHREAIECQAKALSIETRRKIGALFVDQAKPCGEICDELDLDVEVVLSVVSDNIVTRHGLKQWLPSHLWE